MPEAPSISFGILSCSVLVWFFLCRRLFKMLEARHPEKYAAMGRPTLIMNNSLSNNIAFAKFLFRREWTELDDSRLASLGKSMLAFLVVFLVGFLALMVSASLGWPS